MYLELILKNNKDKINLTTWITDSKSTWSKLRVLLLSTQQETVFS